MDTKKEVTHLRRKVGKWLKEWVDRPYSRKSMEESLSELNSYLMGQEDYPSRVDVQTIHFWHLVHFEHAVLNEGQDGWADLALAARYAEAYVRLEEAFADAGKRGMLLHDRAAFYFSLMTIAGWPGSVERVGKALIKGLDTSLLDLRHTERHQAGKVYPHFWFVMHLISEFLGLKFDVSLYSYPDEDVMRLYADVLAVARTDDLAVVTRCVQQLADEHLKETQPTRYEEICSFDGETVMLFPYEILCWLRLREWSGLANPASFDHPLMQSPLARMPAEPLAQPDTPLLLRVVEKFRQEFPDSFR